MLAFLHFSISQTSAYPEILERVKGGDSVIDFGTFFGQDLRKLVRRPILRDVHDHFYRLTRCLWQ